MLSIKNSKSDRGKYFFHFLKSFITDLADFEHIFVDFEFLSDRWISSCTFLFQPTQLDKYAHQMITAKQKYQLLLAQYIDSVRDANNRKKVDF